MAAIADAVMLDNCAVRAMGPFQTCDIGFLENYPIRQLTLIALKPEV